MSETDNKSDKKSESYLPELVKLPITTSIGRKLTFMSVMYLAGGTVIATVGIAPVLVTGVIVWLL